MKTEVLKALSSLGKLQGNFPITQELEAEYQNLYCQLKGTTASTKSSEIKFNTRMARLNLLKYKRFINKIPVREILEGWVYLVTNPAWIGCTKIGRTIDRDQRVSNMQTYSPYRDYKAQNYIFSRDVKTLESMLHEKFKEYRLQGEWFSLTSTEIKKAIED